MYNMVHRLGLCLSAAICYISPVISHTTYPSLLTFFFHRCHVFLVKPIGVSLLFHIYDIQDVSTIALVAGLQSAILRFIYHCGSGEFKMAVSELEPVRSQLVDELEANSLHFCVLQLPNGRGWNTVHPN